MTLKITFFQNVRLSYCEVIILYYSWFCVICEVGLQSGASSCPFVFPLRTVWFQLDGFSWNFILGIFTEFVSIFQFWLKSDKNNTHFMWRPTHLCDISRHWSLQLRHCSLWGMSWGQRKVDSLNITVKYDWLYIALFPTYWL